MSQLPLVAINYVSPTRPNNVEGHDHVISSLDCQFVCASWSVYHDQCSAAATESLVRTQVRVRTTSFYDIYATVSIILQVSSIIFFTYTLKRGVCRCLISRVELCLPAFHTIQVNIYNFLRCTNNVLALQIKIFSHRNLILFI